EFFDETAEWSVNRQAARESRNVARNQALYEEIARWDDSANFDVIYERYSLFGYAGRMYAADRGKPFVLEVNAPLVEETLTHRTLHLTDIARSVERYLFTTADHIVAVSAEVKRYIRSVAKRASVTVVPNGVDPERFAGVVADPALSVPGDGVVIGFLGSLKPWHGIEQLLHAVQQLEPADRNRLHILIFGDSPRLRPELESLSADLGIAKLVTFAGAVSYDEIPVALAGCDILVAPYPEIPGFYFSPLKLFEYMAAGKAIVAARIGQIADILEQDITGLLYTPGQIAELGAALQRVASDAELRHRLGSSARSMARQRHTWAQRVNAVTDIFANLGGARTVQREPAL
ncbi:MAG TPA: glycosyltransferase family 4 protein, partial [candidate division Zixibacteria bacterium]|nr:glycosyltransferase family 4 protein [candidate division Zixibacteria bacterium]